MLPVDFTDRMREMLGKEFDEFISCYDKPEFHALHINTLKNGSLNILDKYNFKSVPWAEHGYYYNNDITPGRHPFHEAGVYYIQEPSAMAPAEFLDVKPYDNVLDLCAAPGGKSTQIACKMQGKGLLISNEIHPARAGILSENIERMGIANAIVTNEDSACLAKHFPEFFDKIMVDAPCSGEGMFRKNSDACNEWSKRNVEICAERQKEILHNASLMLKPGGQMVYSTCTFSISENEDNISYFLKTHHDFYIEHVNISGNRQNQLSPGLIQGTVRLWPHKLNGEGHFLAVLRKNNTPSINELSSMSDKHEHNKSKHKLIKGISQKECNECMDFLKNNLNVNLTECETDNYNIFSHTIMIKFGNNIYIVPDNTPDLKGLKVLRPGLHLGTILKNRFQPSHSLALALSPEQVKHHYCLSLKDDRIYNYLNGQTFSCEGDKGWYLISVDNYSIGWGKLSDSIMKNHYPKGLRKNIPATNTFA